MKDREQLRRVVIRVVTSLLNLIIGPAGAWAALGLKGIVGYIVVHTITRSIVAEASSTNEVISKRGYRVSPLLLFFGGAMPFIWGGWESYVIGVPLLLASFEGAFWPAYHGLRKSSSTEGERKSVKSFQRWEIASTVLAALLVVLLKSEDLDQYGGSLGSALALLAILIPMSEGARGASVGFSTSDIATDKAIFGRLTTGSFGTIAYLTTWSMRIVSMQAGGIALLGLMVALSSLVGFIISEINDRESSPEDADRRNWKVGNYLSLSGIVVMTISLVYTLEEMFLVAYLVCRGGTSGILHHLEVRIAGQLLSGEGGIIGLRERFKFRTQAKILLGYLAFAVAIIAYLGEIPDVEILLIPTLIFSAMCCVLNLHIMKKMKSLQRA
jgi:hypothetical protein